MPQCGDLALLRLHRPVEVGDERHNLRLQRTPFVIVLDREGIGGRHTFGGDTFLDARDDRLILVDEADWIDRFDEGKAPNERLHIAFEAQARHEARAARVVRHGAGGAVVAHIVERVGRGGHTAQERRACAVRGQREASRARSIDRDASRCDRKGG